MATDAASNYGQRFNMPYTFQSRNGVKNVADLRQQQAHVSQVGRDIMSRDPLMNILVAGVLAPDAVVGLIEAAPLVAAAGTWSLAKLGGVAVDLTGGSRVAETLRYTPSSGVPLAAVEGRTTTILGSYAKDMRPIINELGNVKSMDFGPKVGGFNVLNAPNSVFESLKPAGFWSEVNVPFLQAATARGDNILMATRPAFEVTGPSGSSVMTTFNETTGKFSLSGFGREYLTLRQSGYVYQAGKMVKQ